MKLLLTRRNSFQSMRCNNLINQKGFPSDWWGCYTSLIGRNPFQSMRFNKLINQKEILLVMCDCGSNIRKKVGLWNCHWDCLLPNPYRAGLVGSTEGQWSVGSTIGLSRNCPWVVGICLFLASGDGLRASPLGRLNQI
jgi:hypothetical protein